jgi:excisionase family DNA binding protein
MSDATMLTIEAAAARVSLSANMIRKLIQCGVLPALRFSHRNVRISSDALERFIVARAAKAEATRAALEARKRVS